MTRHLPEQARREQILEAARSLFIERGYHPTRMDDIAKAAGLSKGGVYFHFKSKREVFDGLVSAEYERSRAFIEEVTTSEVSFAEKIQTLGQHYLEYFSQAPEAPRFFIVMGEMSLRDPEVAETLLTMQSELIREVSKLVAQGSAEGMLRTVDADAVAAILKALLDGLEGLHALKYPLDTGRLLAAGMDLVMQGLVRRPT